MIKNITIIGCGLIGSSLALAIKKRKIKTTVKVHDKSSKVLNYVKRKGICKNIYNDLTNAVKGSDLIIIATPLSAYSNLLKKIKNNLKKNCILTDTGSAKEEINKIIIKTNLKGISWIASHPIAGTEQSGPSAGYANLFEGRWCILSSPKKTNKTHLLSLKKFWEKLGSKVETMSFKEHDRILALTSHLPHAIAFNTVNTTFKKGQSVKQIAKFSAGGLRDFTRIASSDPLMWRDIFIDNRKNILNVLKNFSENINILKRAIVKKDKKKLSSIFAKSKIYRKVIIKVGQDTSKPNFGRK